MEKIIAFKFVPHEVPPLEKLENSFPYQMKVKLNNGEKLNRKEKDYLYSQLNRSKGIRLYGWRFYFGDFLKTYWVMDRYGDIDEVYALDKTSIRNNERGIRKIVEIQ